MRHAGVMPFNPQAISQVALMPSLPFQQEPEASLTDQLRLGDNDPSLPPAPTAEMVVIPSVTSSTPSAPSAAILPSTPSAPSASQKDTRQPYTPSCELRDFFATLLQKTTPENAPKKGTKRNLIGHGESLTSEEAMERERAAEEEKRKKEQEKAERAEARKKKKAEKTEREEARKKTQAEKAEARKRKKKQPSTTAKRHKPLLDEDSQWFCPQCHGEEVHSTEVWVECEGCQFWYHSSCAGFDGYTEDELEHETFICGICTGEMADLVQQNTHHEYLCLSFVLIICMPLPPDPNP